MPTLLLSGAFLEAYRSATNEYAGKIAKAVRQIEAGLSAAGVFPKGLYVKKLRVNPGQPVWEGRIDDHARLLFTFADNPMPAGAGLKVEPTVRLWNVVLDHDAVERTIRRGWRALVNAEWVGGDELLAERQWQGPLPEKPGADLEAVAAALPDEDPWEAYRLFSNEFDAPDDNRDGNAWYRIDSHALEMHGREGDLPAELLLVREQYECLGAELPLLLSGTAGSGKTTIALYKMRDLALRAPRHRIAYVAYNAGLVTRSREQFQQLPGANRAGNCEFLTYDGLFTRAFPRRSERPGLYGWEEFAAFYRSLRHSRLDPYFVWSELRGVIKGSLPAGEEVERVRPAVMLSLQEYLAHPRRWSLLPPEQRAETYEIARQWQALLKREGKLDDQDLAVEMLRHAGAANGGPFDALILDELQDLTEKQLYAALAVTSLRCRERVLLTGDPTQTLQPTLLDWARVRRFFYLTPAARAAGRTQVPEVRRLHRNFRSAEPIIALSAALLRLLKAHGAEGVEFPEETSSAGGSLPVLTPPTDEVRADLARPDPDRAVLVADETIRDELRRALGHPYVWTTVESKGLEFEHADLYSLPDEIESDPRYDSQAARWLAQHRLRTLYVAVTRARRSLRIIAQPGAQSVWETAEVRACFGATAQPVAARPAPAPEDYQERGRYYYRERQWEQALDCFRRAQAGEWTRALEAKLALLAGDWDTVEKLTAIWKPAEPELGRFVAELSRQAQEQMRASLGDLAGRFDEAIRAGDLTLLQQCLRFSAPNITLDAREHRPLHLAADTGNVEAARALIQAGAKVDATNEHGFTPLMYAAGNGHARLMEMLIQAGADVFARSRMKMTPLTQACGGGHVEAMRLLLDHGVSPNPHQGDGAIPLLQTIEGGHLEATRLLLERGATPNVQWEHHRTPLHAAAARPTADFVNALLDRSAHIDPFAADGFTPLTVAAGRGHIEPLRALISRGANVNARRGRATPLAAAVEFGDLEVTRALLEAGADPNCWPPPTTLLTQALGLRRRALGCLLIEYGADVTARDKQGATAVLHAVTTQDRELLELVLQRGADPNATTDVAPIHVAAWQGDDSFIPLLAAAGANLEARREDGATPLILAARRGHLGTARELVRAGANVDNIGREGITPLLAAALTGNIDMARLLLAHGADRAHRDIYSRTALSIALAYGNAPLAALLQRSGAEEQRDRDNGEG